jgi:hypothetical protein
MRDRYEASPLPPAAADVRAEDSRPVGPPGKCTYCRETIGDNHKPECVVMIERTEEAAVVGEFYDIATYPDGLFALFFFPNGEKGNGGVESAMAFRDDDGVIRGGWSHGGPNSGSDFEFYEPPTMWSRCPFPRPA